MPNDPSKRAALDAWRERLNNSGLPVFARTVREVSHVASDRASSAQDLSDVVSHDAAMAARLIRIANSSMFNLQGRRVDTISAAVVLLGFDSVRELAVSVSVIDEMLKGKTHSRVGQCMARSFHAAAHAKSFARLVDPVSSEEVFVAALLNHVGEMAFWSRADTQAAVLEQALLAGQDPVEAEREVLGFELAALSQTLTKDWTLGDLTRRCHDPLFKDDPAVGCVASGHELALTLEQHGWESETTRHLLDRLAQRYDLAPEKLAEMVLHNMDAAAAIAERFGVERLEYVVPEIPAAEGPGACAGAGPQSGGPRDLASVQMRYLRAISQRLEEGASRDELMQLVVDGVVEGLDGARSYFMLLSPDREKLVVKYASGADRLVGMSRTASGDAVFSRALTSPRVAQDRAKPLAPWHGGGSCLTGGVHVNHRAVGVLYVEMADQATLPEDAVGAFRQFNQQVGLILTGAT